MKWSQASKAQQAQARRLQSALIAAGHRDRIDGCEGEITVSQVITDLSGYAALLAGGRA